MATERKVSVRLDAQVAGFIAGMKTAEAAVRGFGTSAARDIKRVGDEIDKSNDRTVWLAQSLLALGPALVPLGAAAVPVLSGLTTQLTVAAGAAGVAALAFNGIGDGLTALQDYQIDPSVNNLEKLNEALDKIGPAGVEFVRYLDSIGPKFAELANISREGIFPGVQEGIDSLLLSMPQMERVVGNIASGLGDLSSQTGAGLSGPAFEEFFNYLESNAKPLLIEMGNTLGNFAEGLGAMIVAFDPLSQRFSSGFLDMSQSFADWAQGLDQSETFSDFVDYVNSAVPKALDFIGSLNGAFVSLLGAAAPVGDILLPALARFLDVISELADTPLAPVFITLTAAMAAYGRAAALASLSTSGLSKIFANTAVSGATLSAAMGAGRPSIRQFGTAVLRAGQSAEYQTDKTKAANKAVGQFGRAMGPAAGAAGLFALSMTDVDDNLGIVNATLGAQIGLLAGGKKGGIFGAAIGYVADFANANKEADAAIAAFNDTLTDSDAPLSAMQTRLADLQGELSEMTGRFDGGFFDQLANGLSPAGFRQNVDVVLSGFDVDDTQLGKVADETERAEILMGDLRLGAGLLAVELGVVGSASEAGIGDLDNALRVSKPAMDALGYSVEDLIAGVRDGSITQMIDNLSAWQSEADSVAGRTAVAADAFGQLTSEMLPAAEAASVLEDALDSLLSPEMDLTAATDAWFEGLAKLKEELNETSKTLTRQNEAGRQNRAVIQDRISDLKDMVVAEAAAGAPADKIAKKLLRQRDALIDSAAALGVNRNELKKFIRQQGLTPELVTTVFEQLGIDQAKVETRNLAQALGNVPDKVLTDILTNGIPKTKADVDALVAKYKLTEKQRQALLTVVDRASATAANVGRALDIAARDRSSTITVTTRRVFTSAGTPRGFTGIENAYGNILTFGRGGDVPERHMPEMAGPGPTRVWREPETGGETYIPHANDARRPRAKSILEDTAAMFGGSVLWHGQGGINTYAKGGSTRVMRHDRGGVAFRPIGLDALAKEIDKTKESLQDERRERKDLLRDRKAFARDVGASVSAASLTGNGLAGLDLAIQANLNDTRAANRGLRRAERKGLDGPLFDLVASSGDPDLIRQIASQSRGQIAQRERQLAQLNQAERRFGNFAADEKFNRQIEKQSEAIVELRKELKQLRRLEKSVEKGAERGTRKGNNDRSRRSRQRQVVGR